MRVAGDGAGVGRDDALVHEFAGFLVGDPDAGVHVGFPDLDDAGIGELEKAFLVHEPEVGPLEIVVVVGAGSLGEKVELGQSGAGQVVVFELVGQAVQAADEHAGPAAVEAVQERVAGDVGGGWGRGLGGRKRREGQGDEDDDEGAWAHGMHGRKWKGVRFSGGAGSSNQPGG